MFAENIVLETNFGKIRGEIVTIGKRPVARFLGIPYAEQPVDYLRFKRLQPLKRKLDADGSTYNAQTYGNSCLQAGNRFFSTKLLRSEECIFLNIYCPIDEKTRKVVQADRNPVLFLIHGGAFIMGSGGEPYNDLSFFSAQHKAVGVSINYRLNFFGFISWPPVIEENLGLLDQQFALKWVNENIVAFGGDPDNVTIFGSSAGGASVHYHMLSSESSRYFAKGMALSGLLTKKWSMCSRRDQKKKMQRLLKRLNCPANASDEEIRSFLCDQPEENFSALFPATMKDNSIQFGPVECWNMSTANISNKPLILGVTSEEGKLFPDMIFPRLNTSNSTWSREALADVLTEKLFFEPTRKLLDELLGIANFKVYVYLFDYDCQTRSSYYPETVLRSHYGKFHATDVPFALNLMKEESPYMKPSASDLKVTELFERIMSGLLSKDPNCMAMPLRLHERCNQVVNRITENGIHFENTQCLHVKKHGIMLKAASGALLLSVAPERF